MPALQVMCVLRLGPDGPLTSEQWAITGLQRRGFDSCCRAWLTHLVWSMLSLTDQTVMASIMEGWGA